MRERQAPVSCTGLTIATKGAGLDTVKVKGNRSIDPCLHSLTPGVESWDQQSLLNIPLGSAARSWESCPSSLTETGGASLSSPEQGDCSSGKRKGRSADWRVQLFPVGAGQALA